MEDLEILVHISAPTTRKDDELYLSLAKAYLDFEPFVDGGEGGAGGSCPTKEEKSNGENAPHRQDPPGRIATFPPPASGPSFTLLPSLLHKSLEAVPSVTASHEEYFGSLPSEMSFMQRGSDAQKPEKPSFRHGDGYETPHSSRLQQLKRIHAHWEQTTPRVGSVDGPRSLIASRPASLVNQYPLFVEDTQLAEELVESQIQGGFSITYLSDSDFSTTSEEQTAEVPENPQPSTSQSGSSGRRPEVLSSCKDGSKPPLSEVDNNSYLIVGKPAALAQGVPRSHSLKTNIHPSQTTKDLSSSVHPEPSQAPAELKSTVDATEEAEPVDFSLLPTEVFGPQPEISVEQPTAWPSQMTKELKLIKQKNPNRFKPLKKARDLFDDERGYWTIDPSGWPLKAQAEFWKSLSEHVKNGIFKWGVNLFREPPSTIDAALGEQHLKENLGVINVFCWGEIVEHVWLYLWLLSEGKVIGTRATWIDWQEGEIIQME